MNKYYHKGSDFKKGNSPHNQPVVIDRDYREKLISQLGGNPRDVIEFIREFCEKNSKNISSSSIRNLYSEVKRLEMKQNRTQDQDIVNDYDFLLLYPKLAYAIARKKGKNEQEKSYFKLKGILEGLMDAVKEHKIKFSEFSQLFEALIAYHKFYGND